MDEIDWIKNGLQASGKTGAGLAQALGINPSQVTRLLKGERRLRLDEVRKASEYLGTPAPDDLAEIAPSRGFFRPPPVIFGAGDLPVFSATEGGKGEMVVSTDPIEMVPRPWYLKNVRDGYAVVVTGESMEPRYSPGEIVVVNPRAALVRGKDAIITTAREGGDFRAMIKTYLGATADSWKLRQFNPPDGEKQDFSARKREWPFALRVVGRYDGG